MDTSEADQIYKTYRLLEALYPLTVAAALLLGSALPGLIVLQSAKEAAILRALGTTRLRTRVLLAGEQLALCMLGLVLAAAFTLVLNHGGLGSLGSYLPAHLACCAVSAVACSVAVTRRSTLALLQGKE